MNFLMEQLKPVLQNNMAFFAVLSVALSVLVFMALFLVREILGWLVKTRAVLREVRSLRKDLKKEIQDLRIQVAALSQLREAEAEKLPGSISGTPTRSSQSFPLDH